MKIAYAIIAVFLWFFAHTVSAQNMYRNYLSTNIRKPTSAVSVVHSNGYIYFFQADGNGNLSASEIDPLNMNPTGNDYDFQFPNYNIHLNGAFETFGGGFVLFGYYDTGSYITYLAFVVIGQNFSSCDYYFGSIIQQYSGEFTAGCVGRSITDGEVFLLVNSGKLYEIIASNPSNVYCISLNTPANLGDQYTDISWDAIHNDFIVTGSARNSPTGHEDPFVEVFELSNHSISPKTSYYICNQQHNISNVYQSLHTQLSHNELLLYHDLRTQNLQYPYTHDIIWFARIKDFEDANLATVVENWNYELPNAKLSAKDMIYDSKNNRLNFLGVFHQCTAGKTQILAQANPYLLSSGINIGQLGTAFTGGTCQNPQYPVVDIHHNDLNMSNLAWNYHSPCFSVLIAGVGDGLQSLLAETYDISLSSCDVPMWHNDNPSTCILKPYPLSANPSPEPFIRIVPSYPSENITMLKICDEPDICSHQYGDKFSRQSLDDSKKKATIIIESGNQFICEGFEGEIVCSVYDITGKLMNTGLTRNGERNRVNESGGVFFLKAVDSAGNQELKKIVLL